MAVLVEPRFIMPDNVVRIAETLARDDITYMSYAFRGYYEKVEITFGLGHLRILNPGNNPATGRLKFYIDGYESNASSSASVFLGYVEVKVPVDDYRLAVMLDEAESLTTAFLTARVQQRAVEGSDTGLPICRRTSHGVSAQSLTQSLSQMKHGSDLEAPTATLKNEMTLFAHRSCFICYQKTADSVTFDLSIPDPEPGASWSKF